MFFSNNLFSFSFKPVQNDSQHDFTWMTDEANGSVILEQRSRTSLFIQGFFCDIPSQVSGCVSHCCIIGGSHAVYIYVIIPQVDEWYKNFPPILLLGMCLPHLGFLASQGQTSILTGLAF